MSDKMKLTGIELTTKDGKKIGLTIEEAKDLKEQLNGLFGKTETVFVPSAPIIIERDRYPWPYYPAYPTPIWTNPYPTYTTVTCKAESGLQVSYCGNTIE